MSWMTPIHGAIGMLAWAIGAPVVPASELPPVETVGGVSLPAVPAEVATAGVQAAAAERERLGAESTDADLSKAGDAPITIEVTPGTTALLRVARNYLNRLITPFEDPRVLTVNQLEVRKEGASVFLATSSEAPIGVYILSNDPEDPRGISLTLVPARIPPKTIELKWKSATAEDRPRAVPVRAKRWEQSAPYVEKLLELTELVARGQVPPGYSLSANMESGVSCHWPGLTFEPGQRLTGAKFSVFVFRVTNTDAVATELSANAGCAAPGLALVAPWPDAHLEPGTSTELYTIVINDAFDAPPSGQHRPSLLEQAP